MKVSSSLSDEAFQGALAAWATRGLPPRLDATATARLLGIAKHDIQSLMVAGKLKPLGTPAPNAPKWFAMAARPGVAQPDRKRGIIKNEDTASERIPGGTSDQQSPGAANEAGGSKAPDPGDGTRATQIHEWDASGQTIMFV